MDLSPSGIGLALLRNRHTARAPIHLYRWGLGAVLGKRLMLLEHTGRTSGRPRFVCLEVIDRPTHDTLLVASGFGSTSQWYQNLRATPTCFISTGRLRRHPANATMLPADRSAQALSRYRAEHPTSWKFLERVVSKHGAVRPSDIPIVEFRLA